MDTTSQFISFAILCSILFVSNYASKWFEESPLSLILDIPSQENSFDASFNNNQLDVLEFLGKQSKHHTTTVRIMLADSDNRALAVGNEPLTNYLSTSEINDNPSQLWKLKVYSSVNYTLCRIQNIKTNEYIRFIPGWKVIKIDVLGLANSWSLMKIEYYPLQDALSFQSVHCSDYKQKYYLKEGSYAFKMNESSKNVPLFKLSLMQMSRTVSFESH